MTADGKPTTPSTDDDSFSLAHVAAGVNAVPGSLHWGPGDLIAYGAGPAVFLFDQGRGRVRASMVMSETSGGDGGGGGGEGSSSSSGRVCCVRWKGPEAIIEEDGSSCFCWAELASGTSDGFVATWRVRLPRALDGGDGGCGGESGHPAPSSSACCDLPWEQTALLRIDSEAGVTALAWHEEGGEEEEVEEEGKTLAKKKRKSTLVALAGTEAAVFVRSSEPSSSRSSPSAWVPCQRLSIQPRLAHAAALSVLGSSSDGEDSEGQKKKKRLLLLLAVGAVDGATLLFLQEGGAGPPSSSSSSAAAVFSPVPAAAARGHGDWVRGVAFTSKSRGGSSSSSSGSGSGGTEVANGSSSSSPSSSSSSSSLLMATASNDRTVRVWEVSLSPSSSSGGGGAGGRAEEKAGDDDDDDDDDDDVTALAAAAAPSSSKPPSSSSPSSSVAVRLVATLTGHDDWVMSVDWKRRKKKKNNREPPCLLSVSADRSARLWSPAESVLGDGTGDGLWLCDAVVGDAGAAAALGFCGGCFSPDGDGLAAAGPAGAIHVFRREREEEVEEEADEEAGGGGGGGDLSLSPLSLSSRPSRPHSRPRRWEAQPSAGGHCARVVDACWAGPDGACLLSVSEDQTARICTWLAKEEEEKEKETEGGERHSSNPPLWAEVARPQTHGHDFSCVAAVLCEDKRSESGAFSSFSSASPAVYASGSEEKVIRVFEAPRAFSQTLAWARGERDGGGVGGGGVPSAAAASAFGATLPALGLSNKAVHRGDAGSGRGGGGGRENAAAGEGGEEEEEEANIYPEGPDALPAAAPAPLSSRPVEAALAGGTLWPEDVKLYGHGAELSALAATAGGRRGEGGGGRGKTEVGPLFASAAAAKAARWASIRLWRKRREGKEGPGEGGESLLSPWVAAGGGAPGECHALTVTRLAFRETVVVEEEERENDGGGGSHSPPPLLLLASASRDRSFAVHSVVRDEGDSLLLRLETLVHQRGAHSRALTDCAWAPSLPQSSSSSSSSPSSSSGPTAASAFLATSSRDGSVKVWSLDLPRNSLGGGGGGGAGAGAGAGAGEAAAAVELLLELPRARAPATALAFAPRLCRVGGGGGEKTSAPSSSSSNSFSATLAVGSGDGGVQLWTVELLLSAPLAKAAPLWSAPAALRHAAAVRRLSFAPEWARFPKEGEEEEEAPSFSSSSWLASVGDDGAVRVFRCRC